MKFLKICFVLCTLSVLAFMSMTGRASTLLYQQPPSPAPILAGLNQQPFTEEKIIKDEESFKAAVKTFHKIPFNDNNLEFDISLPSSWTAESFSQKDGSMQLDKKAGRKILEDVARFRSPMISTAQAVVSIKAVNLLREISAESWMKNFIYSNGYAIQGKVLPINNKRANAYFVAQTEGRSTLSYATVQINGKTAVMAQFEIPFSLKEPMEFLQKRSIESFRLILMTEAPVETQKSFSLGDGLQFDYPESWAVLYPDYKNLSRMSVQLHNQAANKKLDGFIRFLVVRRGSDTTLKKEIDGMRKYFDGFLEIIFKKLVSSDKAPTYHRFILSRYEVYQIASKKKAGPDQEIRFAVLGDKEWYIFIFLLTPGEADDLAAWATNTQTFDMILKNMR